MEFIDKIIEMTSFHEFVSEPYYLVMIAIGILLLFLGIFYQYKTYQKE